MNLKHYALLSVVIAGAQIPLFAAAEKVEITDRLQNAATAMQEIMKAPDQGIPEDLLRDARCAVVVPSLKKGAFIVGAKYGKGFLMCRDKATQAWSAPAAIRIEGGSVGFQIGGSETDVVMLVMNDKGEQTLLASKFTVGGEGEVAAGPVGRDATAQTDAKLTAGILSWSRSRGAFAGVSLQGATLREDKEDNKLLYGKEMTSKEVVNGKLAMPSAAQPLVRALTVTAAAGADREQRK